LTAPSTGAEGEKENELQIFGPLPPLEGVDDDDPDLDMYQEEEKEMNVDVNTLKIGDFIVSVVEQHFLGKSDEEIKTFAQSKEILLDEEVMTKLKEKKPVNGWINAYINLFEQEWFIDDDDKDKEKLTNTFLSRGMNERLDIVWKLLGIDKPYITTIPQQQPRSETSSSASLERVFDSNKAQTVTVRTMEYIIERDAQQSSISLNDLVDKAIDQNKVAAYYIHKNKTEYLSANTRVRSLIDKLLLNPSVIKTSKFPIQFMWKSQNRPIILPQSPPSPVPLPPMTNNNDDNVVNEEGLKEELSIYRSTEQKPDIWQAEVVKLEQQKQKMINEIEELADRRNMKISDLFVIDGLLNAAKSRLQYLQLKNYKESQKEK
jgi:hypothetical protein